MMTTKYNMVKQAVKSKIVDGTYKPHQKISSESELMEEFDVSRHTVRQAIGDLVIKGWLYREQGSGTFCADRSKLKEDLSRSNQKNIAIVTTYISDYIFPSIIRGAEARLSEEGYQVSIFSTNNDHENERQVLEKVLEQNFDGVIIEPTKSAYSNPNITYYLHLERLSIPYIMIHSFYDELEPVSIIMDDELGGYLQTEHLINHGHKNIVGCFKTDDAQGTRRMKGFLKAHRKHNIPINPRNLITYNTEERFKKPLKKIEKLLNSKENQITGLVCYNDELAVKVLNILRKKSIKVPEDLSLVGYDNSFLTEVSEVKLTSIKHPQSKMGEAAANKVIDLINVKNKGASSNLEKSIIFTPELVTRKSTRQLL